MEIQQNKAMLNQVQFIQTQNIGSTFPAQLKDGGEVFVRVLKDNGGGSYTVSFGGNRVDVTSQKPLSPGDSFRAVLNLSQNGQVNLSPLKESSGNVANPYLMQNSLLSQGIIPDQISQRMVAFFQQTGLRVDRSIMEKARQIAKSFPGKEEAASEAAALLLEKGINADEASVKKMLIMAFGSDGDTEGGSGSNPRQEEDKGDNPEDRAGVASGKSINKEDLEKQVKELVTLVNHTKEGPKHWFFLPYTWNFGEREASGVIRMLLNLETNQTEKMEINCKIDLKKYYFVLYYTLGKVKEIRFCSLPPLLTPDISKEERRLGDLFSSGMSLDKSVKVTYSSSAFIGGICADGEDFLVCDREA